MPLIHVLRASLVGVALLVVCAGCGPGNPLGRKAVSGKVTLDDQPLEQGNIAFEPQKKGGVSAGGPITAGQFSIAKKKGLPAGEYLVRIHASAASSKPDPSQPPGPGAGIAAKELIPEKYNTRSTTVVSVAADKPAEFNFDLKSK
jgi:hypothetical protein